MAVALWVSLGVVAGIAALACLYAPLLKRSLVGLQSRRLRPSRLWRPRVQRVYLPPRFAARERVLAPGRRTVRGLTKSEAEDLLDWLEAHDVRRREVAYADEDGYAVSYS